MQSSRSIGMYDHLQSSGSFDKYGHSDSDLITNFKETLFLNHKIPPQK